MASVQALEIRPRTTGEILDDAWRLYFADAPRLLLLHGLFYVPALSVFLLLVASPPPASLFLRWLPPFVAALLLPLSGLSSGALQERLRRLAEGRDARPTECVGAALRRGLAHTAAQSLLLLLVAAVAGCLVALPAYITTRGVPGVAVLVELVLLVVVGLPAVILWSGLASLHTLIADTPGGLFQALGRLGAEARFDPGKAFAVAFTRLPLLGMAFINAHLLVQVAVWAAGNLGGFDVALLGFQFDLGNPVYDLALVLTMWLLLAPFFETANYLLYLDTRTRREGLDLLYRVQRAFSAVDPKHAAVLLAAVAGWLFGVATLSSQAAAPADRVATVRQVRAEVAQLHGEVKDADPYRAGEKIERQLRQLGDQLEDAWPGERQRFPWYWETVDGFQKKARAEALHALDELQRRLALLEDALSQPAPETHGTEPAPSKADVKKLLRERHDEPAPAEAKKKQQEDNQDKEEPKKIKVHHDEPGDGGSSGGGAPGVSVPQGFGNVCWLVFAGLLLAVAVTGLVMFLVNRPWGKRSPAAQTGRSDVVTEQTVEQLHQQPVAELLRRADALAEQGHHLEALRTAFLATLSLLHRKQLLRYEPTRTNGEYVREVRLAAHAPAALHEPFNQLTTFFEVKWYGERSCEARDYRAARAFVETIQGLVGLK